MSERNFAILGVSAALTVVLVVLAYRFGPEFALFSGFIVCAVFWIVDRIVCLMEGIDPTDEPTDVF